MNLSGVSITKSNKTNKNIFKVKKILPQSDKLFQYHNEYQKVGFFVRTSPLLVRLQETVMFDDPRSLCNESNHFRRFLPWLITPPGNTPSKLSLVSS